MAHGGHRERLWSWKRCLSAQQSLISSGYSRCKGRFSVRVDLPFLLISFTVAALACPSTPTITETVCGPTSKVELSCKTQCPTSLCQRLSDSFKCSICLNTINPPVIYAHCCNALWDVRHVLMSVNRKTAGALCAELILLQVIEQSSLYLEEDLERNAEFPNTDGSFQLSNRLSARYKVSGDNESVTEDETTPRTPLVSQSNVWSVSHPWSVNARGRIPSTTRNSLPGPSYETAFYKRSIPLVTLSLSRPGWKESCNREY